MEYVWATGGWKEGEAMYRFEKIDWNEKEYKQGSGTRRAWASEDEGQMGSGKVRLWR